MRWEGKWTCISTRRGAPVQEKNVPIVLTLCNFSWWIFKLNIRLRNIQKFPGRQREISMENVFRSPSYARLTLQLLSFLKPAWVFPSSGVSRKKGSMWDKMSRGRMGREGRKERKGKKQTQEQICHILGFLVWFVTQESVIGTTGYTRYSSSERSQKEQRTMKVSAFLKICNREVGAHVAIQR